MNKSVNKPMTAEQARQFARQARAEAAEVVDLAAPTINPLLLADTTDNTVKSGVLLDDAQTLTISIPAWDTFAPPESGLYDTLFIYHSTPGGGREELFSQEYDSDDVDQFPLPFIVTKDRVKSWGEGLQNFSYEVLPFSGGARIESEVLGLRFDRIPPYNQATPPPFAPIADVTDANINNVDLTLPPYADYAAGDKVYVYWLNRLPDDPGAETPVLVADVKNPPEPLRVPPAAITAAGDGGIYALYLLVDKAGNISKLAQYAPVGVAIGPLPSGLQDPIVPLAVDGLIDQEDVFTGVDVRIPTFANYKSTDEFQVTWGTLALGWNPIGNAPTFPLIENLLPLQVWEQYGASSTGDKPTPVSYEVRRGTVPAGKRSIDVDVNLERIGPVDPGPDPEWPDPVNPKLDPVTVQGAVSKTDNELKPEDEKQPATLTFVLDATFEENDEITFYWENVHITEADYVVTADDPGEEIEATIPWAYIEERNNGVVPVHYEIRRAGVPNRSISSSTHVTVNAIVLRPEAPKFLGGNTEAPVGWLTCASLFDKDDPSDVTPSIRVAVPDLSEYGLEVGQEITMHWTAVHGFSGETPIPDVDKDEIITLTAGNINGFVWRVEPYEDHILPIPNFNTSVREGRGRASYSFTLKGALYTSDIEQQIVSMHQLGAACPITP